MVLPSPQCCREGVGGRCDSSEKGHRKQTRVLREVSKDSWEERSRGADGHGGGGTGRTQVQGEALTPATFWSRSFISAPERRTVRRSRRQNSGAVWQTMWEG